MLQFLLSFNLCRAAGLFVLILCNDLAFSSFIILQLENISQKKEEKDGELTENAELKKAVKALLEENQALKQQVNETSVGFILKNQMLDREEQEKNEILEELDESLLFQEKLEEENKQLKQWLNYLKDLYYKDVTQLVSYHLSQQDVPVKADQPKNAEQLILLKNLCEKLLTNKIVDKKKAVYLAQEVERLENRINSINQVSTSKCADLFSQQLLTRQEQSQTLKSLLQRDVEFKKLIEENNFLKDQLNLLVHQDFHNTEQLSSVNNNLLAKNDYLQHNIKLLKNELNKKKQLLVETHEVLNELVTRQQSIGLDSVSNQNCLKELYRENTSLKNQLFKTMSQNPNPELEAIKEEYLNCIEQLSFANEFTQNCMVAIEEASEENAELERIIIKKDKAIRELEDLKNQEKDQLEKQYQMILAQSELLILDLTKELNLAQKKGVEQQQEKNEILNALTVAQAELENAREENNDLEQLILDKDEDLQELANIKNQEKDQLEQQYQTILAQSELLILDLTKELKMSQKEAAALQQENSDILSALTMAQADLDKTKEVLNDTKNCYQTNLKTFENFVAKIGYLGKGVWSFKAIKDQALIDLSQDLSQKLKSIEKDFVESQNKLKENSEMHKKHSWLFRKKLEHARGALDQAMKERKKVKQALIVSEQHVDMLKNSLSMVHQDYYDSIEFRKNLEQGINDLSQEITTLSEKLSASDAKIQKKKSKIQNLKSVLNKSKELLLAQNHKNHDKIEKQKEALLKEVEINQASNQLFAQQNKKYQNIIATQLQLINSAFDDIENKNIKLAQISEQGKKCLDIACNLNSAIKNKELDKSSLNQELSLLSVEELEKGRQQVSQALVKLCKNKSFEEIAKEMLPPKNSVTELLKDRFFLKNATTQEKTKLLAQKAQEIQSLENVRKLKTAYDIVKHQDHLAA